MSAIQLSIPPRASFPERPLVEPVEQQGLDPGQRLAFLAVQGHLKPNEIAYRRARLRGARRFFSLDIHKEYALAFAVDGELNTVHGPVRFTWERFPAWINKTLTKDDAVVIEMTTSAP